MNCYVATVHCCTYSAKSEKKKKKGGGESVKSRKMHVIPCDLGGSNWLLKMHFLDVLPSQAKLLHASFLGTVLVFFKFRNVVHSEICELQINCIYWLLADKLAWSHPEVVYVAFLLDLHLGFLVLSLHLIQIWFLSPVCHQSPQPPSLHPFAAPYRLLCIYPNCLYWHDRAGGWRQPPSRWNNTLWWWYSYDNAIRLNTAADTFR